ncbi:MAG: DUF58 domain-containing protein [Anaerolineaceae bacterium 4572_78]|nr:MAG: DUF58 domain-containing protein [Anaerolineaceae bacterium 4572_78]
MLSSDLIKKIRQIEIYTRHLVNDTFAGEYHAVFKGRGMEFDEVRPYQYGDEIRSIDWNVTARMGEPYIKRYIEERELTVMLVVDRSGSGEFGTINRFKREVAVELAAVLSISATTNNDKVGLLIFTDKTELFIPPRKGRRHVLRIIRELLAFEPTESGTNIKCALDELNHMLKRRSIIFLISDFFADPQHYYKTLFVTNRRHDVVAVDLHDPLEIQFANVGLIALEDAETGNLAWIDTTSRAWQQAFMQQRRQRNADKIKNFRRIGLDTINVSTDKDYVVELTKFFRMRSKRLRK